MKHVLFMIFLCLPLSSYARDTDMEEKIRQVLINSPEIVMNAQETIMEKMSQKFDDQKNKHLQNFLHENPGALERLNAPALGNGHKKVFGFISPYCKHCQGMLRDFFALVQKNPNYRVSLVWSTHKEDKGGLVAARALLAAQELGKLKEFFEAMSDQVNMLEKKDALEIAEKIGLDISSFQEKMESKAIGKQLKEMRALTEKLSLSGFPTLIYEKEFMPGEYGIIEGRPEQNTLESELEKGSRDTVRPAA